MQRKTDKIVIGNNLISTPAQDRMPVKTSRARGFVGEPVLWSAFWNLTLCHDMVDVGVSLSWQKRVIKFTP